MAKIKKALTKYRKKRNFKITPEPSGGPKPSDVKPLFVIQKHEASHLHYDFRIEIDGVLASWAVPKGISTDPSVKHLAMPTEDHPYAYAHFEGIIPQGEYGGGTVMVWDIGTYRNLKEKNGKPILMAQCKEMGSIEIWLEGKKLKGGYVLIRTARKTGEPFWLLIKMRDKYADTKIPRATKSALTGRTMKQIEEAG